MRSFLKDRTEAAFRALYALHTGALYRVALRLLAGRDADAEDVVQETWVRAVRNLGDFRWQSSLRSWLTGIAVNCVRERQREALREEDGRREVVERVEGDGNPRTPSAAESFERVSRAELSRAIEGLPAGYREVLILHDVEGHTHEVVAGMLGISEGTSKSQLSRARRRLREALAPGTRGEGSR